MSSDKPLKIHTTAIDGLLLVDLPVHGDSRGWFKENWQREKMVAVGLPDFGPVQNNISFNDEVGVTRGIHAEPWDKFVSVASGRIFGAWVDLRAGDGFGTVATAEVDAATAVFVPRGVGNAYQTLQPSTAYTYLVNQHWTPAARYTALNLADSTVAIAWPIPLAEAVLSDKDRANPYLADVTPMSPQRVLVLGGNGQLGRALRETFPNADYPSSTELDITDPTALAAVPWHEYSTILNAAAYTNVDGAETTEGRATAWQVNATAVGYLARIATEHHLRLVHISSEYVFDGTKEEHAEDEPFSPLGVYGQSKAAGDIAAATTPKHYIVRTSWVIGDGPNFIRTMQRLAEQGINPEVVNDQYGRLTYTQDLATGIQRLININADFGTYNLTSPGPVTTWYEVAREAFEQLGHDPMRVRPISTEDYFARLPISAPRPRYSVLGESILIESRR